MKVESLSSRHFEVKDINKLLDIDKNKLFYWIKTHRLLKPEIEEASGTGSRAKFSLKNLLEILTIKELLNIGLDLNSIKKIKKKISSYKKHNKDIYSLILEFDEIDREDVRLFIYKSKDNIYLYFSTPLEGADEFGPFTYPDFDTWDREKYPKKSPSYGGIFVQLGLIANNLIKKVAKI